MPVRRVRQTGPSGGLDQPRSPRFDGRKRAHEHRPAAPPPPPPKATSVRRPADRQSPDLSTATQVAVGVAIITLHSFVPLGTLRRALGTRVEDQVVQRVAFQAVERVPEQGEVGVQVVVRRAQEEVQVGRERLRAEALRADDRLDAGAAPLELKSVLRHCRRGRVPAHRSEILPSGLSFLYCGRSSFMISCI